MTYIVKTNQLTKVYEGNEVVANVNLHVKKGEIYGFFGSQWCRENDSNENVNKPY